MPKQDFDHHQPRPIDKKKHHRYGFSEEIQEVRKTRVSFKNYVRQMHEEELGDDADEQWIVEEGITYSDNTHEWVEVAGPFLDEDDAEKMLSEMLETADENEQYRVTKL